MDNKLYLYNTLSRRKELFKPVNPSPQSSIRRCV